MLKQRWKAQMAEALRQEAAETESKRRRRAGRDNDKSEECEVDASDYDLY